MKPVSLVVMIFLVLIAIAQFLRFALQVELTVGSFNVSPWLSLLASAFIGTLAFMLWRESRKK